MPDFGSTTSFFTWQSNLFLDTLLHHCAWSMDGEADTIRFYFDGMEQNVFVRYAPEPPNKVYTGLPIEGDIGIASPALGNPQDLMEGIVDEFRISRGARTPEWIRTEYRNQSDAAFFQFGEEERQVGIAPHAPEIAARLRVYPNPFQAHTRIEFEVDRSRVEVAVYDLSGRQVRVLHPARVRTGAIRLEWDGRTDGGRQVARGIYFIRVRVGATSFGNKVILAR